MKSSSIVKIVCWSLTAVILTSVLAGVIGFKGFWNDSPFRIFGINFDDSDDSFTTSSSTGYHKDEINSVSIEWVAGKVIIEKTDGDSYSYKEEANGKLSNSEKAVSTVEDGELKIRAAKKRISTGNKLSKTLTVYVPEDVDEFNIVTVSADVEISGVTASNWDFETVSAVVNAKAVTADTVDYDCVSGNIKLEGAFRSIDGESVSGDCEVRSSLCPDSIDVESVSGNISLYIPEDSGFSVKKSGTGLINTDFEGTGNKNTFMCQNGSSDFDFDSVSGGISIYKLTA